MKWLSVVVALLPVAAGHVPFFVETSGYINRPVDVSQAYYFRAPGRLRATADRLPASSVVEVLTRTRQHCNATVSCDGTATTVSMATAGDAVGEPFSQSAYRVALKFPAMTCRASFSVTSNCNLPWAAVIGTGEKFTAGDLLSMPAAVAKIHGSWWNGRYVVGHVVPYVVIAALSTVVATGAVLTSEQWLLVAAFSVSLSWLVAKLYHAAAFAKTGAAAGVALLELWPLLTILWLWYDRRRWVGLVAVGASVGMLFVVGTGFVWAPIFIAAAGIMHYLPPDGYAAVKEAPL